MSEENRLTPENVMTVYVECVVGTGEQIAEHEAVTVDGLRGRVVFRAERLTEQRALINRLLAQLPEQFEGEFGALFTQAYGNRDNQRWTSLSDSVGQLLELGMAIGRIQPCDLGRRNWGVWPEAQPRIRLLPEQ